MSIDEFSWPWVCYSRFAWLMLGHLGRPHSPDHDMIVDTYVDKGEDMQSLNELKCG